MDALWNLKRSLLLVILHYGIKPSFFFKVKNVYFRINHMLNIRSIRKKMVDLLGQDHPKPVSKPKTILNQHEPIPDSARKEVFRDKRLNEYFRIDHMLNNRSIRKKMVDLLGQNTFESMKNNSIPMNKFAFGSCRVPNNEST
ncbi:hypothetical protein YC2023_095569 [Brassica napus]